MSNLYIAKHEVQIPHDQELRLTELFDSLNTIRRYNPNASDSEFCELVGESCLTVDLRIGSKQSKWVADGRLHNVIFGSFSYKEDEFYYQPPGARELNPNEYYPHYSALRLGGAVGPSELEVHYVDLFQPIPESGDQGINEAKIYDRNRFLALN